MDITLIILMPVITFGLTIAAFMIARYAEARKKGANDASIKKDVEYIKETTTSIKKDLDKMDARLSDHTERIVVVEQKVNSAHRRLDELSKKPCSKD